MSKTEKLIFEKGLRNISDYFSLDKIIEQEKDQMMNKRNVKIALLTSFTAGGIKEVLNVKCYQLGICAEFFIAPYNQYLQQILDRNSLLYKFNPDITIVFIDIKSLFGEYFYFPYRLSIEERKDLIDKIASELTMLIETLQNNSKNKIILHNFEVPFYSPMGILEYKMPFGFIESVETLNNKLEDKFRGNYRVFLFNYDGFCSKYGKKNLCDPKMYYLGDIKVDFKYIILLCNEYLSYIKPHLNLSRKCLILDLDNTLWGGILGEDGLEGIRLGQANEGKPFLEFQKYILSLHERGIILGINSHNNPNDVYKVFREHPYMILKEEHFAVLKINWDNKVTNMIQIAKEINIGLDSIVYIDDDFRNRELIKNYLPDIHVVDLPEDPCLYIEALMEVNDFNVFQITDEDKSRGKMYAEQRKRHELLASCSNIHEFLKKLDVVITICKADSFTIPRIAQLTQRTNQFNTTTKRCSEDDIRKFTESDSFFVFAVKVEDRFGDNGIVGSVIIRYEDSKTWLIDSFLLSCRVLGREIEKAILSFIINKALKNNIETLLGVIISTEKNIPVREFYKNNGFILKEKNDEIQVWEMKFSSPPDINLDFIKIVEKV